MDINDNKLKRFYTVSAAIGYILCSLYAFIYCASYGLVHLHLPILSESVLSGMFDDFFYFSEATIVVLLVFAIVCVGVISRAPVHRVRQRTPPAAVQALDHSVCSVWLKLRGIRQLYNRSAPVLHRAGGSIPSDWRLYRRALRAQREELLKVKAFAAENISRKCLREQDKPNKYQSRYHCDAGSVCYLSLLFSHCEQQPEQPQHPPRFFCLRIEIIASTTSRTITVIITKSTGFMLSGSLSDKRRTRRATRQRTAG